MAKVYQKEKKIGARKLGLSYFFFLVRVRDPPQILSARAQKKIKYQKKITCFGLQNQCCAQKKNISKKNIRKKKMLKFSNFFFNTFPCTPHRHIFFYFLFFIFYFWISKNLSARGRVPKKKITKPLEKKNVVPKAEKTPKKSGNPPFSIQDNDL